MDWTDMAELGAAEAGAGKGKLLLKPCDGGLTCIAAIFAVGSPANLAITYLRQIVDDEDRLATLTSRDCVVAPAALNERLY